MSVLSVGLVVEVHLLLKLQGLLELLLELFKVSLRLVALLLQELESALPKSALLVKKVPLLL